MRNPPQFAALVGAIVLLAQATTTRADPPPQPEVVHAIVRLPSHGASATIIETSERRTILLGCAHAYSGSDRSKPMAIDCPFPSPDKPKKVGLKLLKVNSASDLSLVELNTGPLPYVAPVAPARHQPSSELLSVGFDEMRLPATIRRTTIVGQEGDRTLTREKPWHGRSGGALLDAEAGYLIGVVSGYEVNGPRSRGIYVSHQAILRFLNSDLQIQPKRFYEQSPCPS